MRRAIWKFARPGGSLALPLRLALPLVICAVAGAGDPLRDRLVDAQGQLSAGDAEGALSAYRDIQTDEPANEYAKYGVAAAQYRQALQDLTEAPEDGLAKLEEARAGFTALDASADAGVRLNSRFLAANCSAQMAMNSAAVNDREKMVKAFEDAIREYEDVLTTAPDHSGARTNLNHMRYLLKSTLQQPPPENEPQKQGGPPDQEQQPSDDKEHDDQKKQQEGDQPKTDQNQQEEQNEEQQSKEQDQQQEGQEASQAQPGEDQQESEQEKPEDQAPNLENIQAILKNLEDIDRDEQKNLRHSKEPGRVRGNKWW
ncbi:MAG: hypothetical protein AAB353_03845 [Candidatus Hydrogenedentota bacterium]